MPKVTVHRKAHFNAAHRLYRKDWSDAKNFEIKKDERSDVHRRKKNKY